MITGQHSELLVNKCRLYYNGYSTSSPVCLCSVCCEMLMAASPRKNGLSSCVKCFHKGSKITLCGPRTIYSAEVVKLVLLMVLSFMLLIFYVRFCLELRILYMFFVELKSRGNSLVNSVSFSIIGQRPFNRILCTAMF